MLKLFLGAPQGLQPGCTRQSRCGKKDFVIKEQDFPQLFKDQTGSVSGLFFVSLGI